MPELDECAWSSMSAMPAECSIEGQPESQRKRPGERTKGDEIEVCAQLPRNNCWVAVERVDEGGILSALEAGLVVRDM